MRKSDVARYIMRALPVAAGKGGHMPIDHLALVLLLEAEGPLTVAEIRDALEIAQPTASELVAAARDAARVTTASGVEATTALGRALFDNRMTLVGLAPRAILERKRSRGANRPHGVRHKPYRKREQPVAAE